MLAIWAGVLGTHPLLSASNWWLTICVRLSPLPGPVNHDFEHVMQFFTQLVSLDGLHRSMKRSIVHHFARLHKLLCRLYSFICNIHYIVASTRSELQPNLAFLFLLHQSVYMSNIYQFLFDSGRCTAPVKSVAKKPRLSPSKPEQLATG